MPWNSIMPFLKSLFFLLFITQILSPQSCSAIAIRPKDWVPGSVRRFKPTAPNSSRVDIEIEKITKALQDSGFDTMSASLEKNLRSSLPYQDSQQENHNSTTITLYNNRNITIFVPTGNETIIDDDYFVDSHGFPNLDTRLYHPARQKKHSSRKYDDGMKEGVAGGRKCFCLNSSEITHWNIYNDGQVIVHGVNKPFDRAVGYDLDSELAELTYMHGRSFDKRLPRREELYFNPDY